MRMFKPWLTRKRTRDPACISGDRIMHGARRRKHVHSTSHSQTAFRESIRAFGAGGLHVSCMWSSESVEDEHLECHEHAQVSAA